MRSLPSGTLASLQSSEIKHRGMILFDFPSGQYGLWEGSSVFTHDGIDYQPGGQLLEIDDMSFSSGLAAQGLTVRLSAVPNSNLTPDVLATIEDEQYIGRPVTIYSAYFDPNGALLSVERVWRGYVDQMRHEFSPQPNGGSMALVCQIESKNLDNQKRGHRMRGSADQARISAGDKFFDHVAVIAQQEINWGRLPQKGQ